MRVINVRNVNNAVAEAIPYLLVHGDAEPSRNGDVIVAPEPVTTVYNKPTERVLFGETRDANPFFHLMEALWMLAGRNDLAFPVFFNKNFASYSDDGVTVHGAYGHRWREALGYDQLELIAEELIRNPASRRCVLQMWDAVPSGSGDLQMALLHGGKDVPCNTQVYFDVRYGVLNMTVTCRSNDIIWGAYGANVVHMSILQEYMAAWIGVPVGVYRQVSNNFHAYTDIYDREKLRLIAREANNNNFYLSDNPIVKPAPLVNGSIKEFDQDLEAFFNSPSTNEYHGSFFRDTVRPMYLAWEQRKRGTGTGMELAVSIAASDWRAACTTWIARREAAHVAI